MKVCVLGGGGNVAEAVAAWLHARRHEVFLYRFPKPIPVEGIPPRPRRSAIRLAETRIVSHVGRYDYSGVKILKFIEKSEFKRIDVFIFAFPSFLAEHCGRTLGPHVAGRPFINLSDRFLGTASFLAEVINQFGPRHLPQFSIAFNGVPVLAQKPSRDAPLRVFYVKPRHAFSVYPQV